MPRLHHKKTRTGCTRCKARKVKCDEVKPTCSACHRHDVACEYRQPSPYFVEQQPLPTPPQDDSNSPNDVQSDDQKLDHVLELRLMHEWTAYVAHNMSAAWEYWQFKAPLVALKHRYAMDALLALSAFHASKQSPEKTIDVQGNTVTIRDPLFGAEGYRDQANLWVEHPYKYQQFKDTPKDAAESEEIIKAAQRHTSEMLAISRMYFDRAIDGHRKALATLNTENIEAVYLTSVLVSFIALFTLSESEDDDGAALPTFDPILWVRLSDGTRTICRQWDQLVGPVWMTNSGAFYGAPDLTDDDELFRVEHAAPFWKLLTYAQEYEIMSAEDQKTYQWALSYIGLMYQSIVEKSEHPLASCRRLIAMPAKLPDQFIRYLEQKQPRATVILAYGFAIMKLIEKDVIWFAGVAQKQIPRMFSEIPPGWQQMMKWPMAIANGLDDEETTKTYLRELRVSSN